MPKTPFDPDFYVVCATVIPVLFLALAVQGDAYRSLLNAALKARITKPEDGRVRKLGAIVRAKTLQQIGYFIWLAGAIGECLAIWRLYQNQEEPSDRLIVLWCTVFLVLAVAMGPLNLYVELRKKMDKWRREAEPGISVADPTNKPCENSSVDVDGPRGERMPDGSRVDKATHPSFNPSGLGWPQEDGKPHSDDQGRLTAQKFCHTTDHEIAKRASTRS